MANQPSDKGKDVLRQFDVLKTLRSPLDREYRECYEFTYSALGTGFGVGSDGDGVSNAQTTAQNNAKKLDTTATDAVRLLASSVLSSLTPPNNRWFDLAVSNLAEDSLDQDGKEWLKDSADRIHALIHGSNYDSVAMDFVLHQMIAGMAGLYVELRNGKFRFEVWPLNHLYVQETLNEGYIDTVYRQFFYTVGAAANEFGLASLPQRMQELLERNPHDTKLHRFVVGIRPRIKGGKQSTGRTKRNMPWESIWVSDCGCIVRESGFEEMPVIVPRWLKVPDTDYARGPVFDALPDIKSLNKVMENMHLNMEMHISGMFLYKEDGVVNPAAIRFGPRRFIPVLDTEAITPLRSGGDINFAMNQVQNLQMSVRRVLLADQLGPTEKAIQTATEVQTRNNQARQILGPIFARFQSEYLTHLIARCYGLAARGGLLPPVPDSLRGNEMEVDYRSPLARAQKMQEIEQIDAFRDRVLMMAQSAPELLDLIDGDAAVRAYADMLGVDPSLLKDADVVKRERYMRQKQQEQLMQAQMAQSLKEQSQEPQP